MPMPDTRPADWLSSSLGRQLLAAEAELLRGLLDDVFGLELLQLGSWGASRELLSASRTRRQTVIADNRRGEVDLVARLDALPVQTASVDAVLLPHTLEFEADPQAIVREADRVLTGEGQLIVLGFRPVSLWGLRAAASRAGFPAGPAADARARPRARLARPAGLRSRAAASITSTAGPGARTARATPHPASRPVQSIAGRGLAASRRASMSTA